MRPRVKLWLPVLLSLLLVAVIPVQSQQLQINRADDYYRRALDPFWRTNEMHESCFFIEYPPATAQDQDKGRDRDDSDGRANWPKSKLLFIPNEVLSVTSMSHEITYEEGRDYVVDRRTGTLYLPPTSRIPFKTTDQLFPLLTSKEPRIPTKAGDPTRGVLWQEGPFYQSMQVLVTYTLTPGQWTGYVPQYAGSVLPNTTAKLAAGKQIKIFVVGDSISQGYNSSKWIDVPPFQPPYEELVAGGLETAFHAQRNIVGSYRNYAISGWIAAQGLAQVNALQIGADQPDLVLIAFGANDVVSQTPAQYQTAIQGIISAIRAQSPNTEFILVSSMIANGDWSLIPVPKFAQLRDALAQLTGPGIALADVTAVWQTLLQRKTFYDITGNGVNHPNDFSHMLYAQTILGLLIPGPVAYVGLPDQVAVTQDYQLDATGSLAGPNGPINYQWQMTTKSNPATITGANTATPTIHFNAGPGTYFLTLTVTDAQGVQNTEPITLTYVQR